MKQDASQGCLKPIYVPGPTIWHLSGEGGCSEERAKRYKSQRSIFGEFISPTKVALVCLKFILSFIKFCSLVTVNLWILNQIKGSKSCTTDTL